MSLPAAPTPALSLPAAPTPAPTPALSLPAAPTPALSLPAAPTPAPNKKFDSPVPIISPQYCVPHELNLAIVREVLNITNSNFVVTDVNGKVIFKVNGKLLSIPIRVEILDGAGNHVLTLQPKSVSTHGRWNVYRGDSVKESDKIFSVKRTSILQARTKLHVFLANNTEENTCDFKVEGSWKERSCVVCAGKSSSTVAKMDEKKTVEGALIRKNHFNVTINPYIDYAFIVALVVIFDALSRPVEIATAGVKLLT